MSAPITPAAFAAALPALPLSSLRLKAAELRNSIAHLLLSNAELLPYAQAGDKDCGDAIDENKEVIKRMEERLELLKQEVEGRGLRWEEGDMPVGEAEREEEEKAALAGAVNGEVAEQTGRLRLNGDASEGANGDGSRTGDAPGGRRGLSDEELARRLREQMEEEGVDL